VLATGDQRFKLRPGYADPIRLKLKGTLLAKLKRMHRLRTLLTVFSHDGAERPHHKHLTRILHLAYG
jgi:hypothetical protein